MRVGVIGLAGVGRTHINKWSEIAELVRVCDLDSTVLAQVTKSCQINGYTNAEQMLDQEDLQAISVCTPPKSHLSITRQAADRGIHVLCEKPMASTVGDCQAMIDICSRQSVVLQIGHKKRFLPAIQRLKEISEGDFGPIQYMVHRYPHPGTSSRDWFWAEDDGGGPILENAVHAADILGFLMGDVTRVYAEGGNLLATGHRSQIDCAVYTLRFASGAIGVVNAGMVSTSQFNFEDYYAATSAGVAEVKGKFDSADTIRYSFRSHPDQVEEQGFPNFDAFRAEMEHFVDCIKTGAEPLADGHSGMKAVAICRAVKQSSATGTPIEL